MIAVTAEPERNRGALMVPVASAMASMAPIIAVAAVMTVAGVVWVAVTVIAVAGAPLSGVGIGAGGKGDNQHRGQGELQEPHGAFLPDRVLGGAGRDMSATPMSSKFGIVMATISRARVRPGLSRRLPSDPMATSRAAFVAVFNFRGFYQLEM